MKRDHVTTLTERYAVGPHVFASLFCGHADTMWAVALHGFRVGEPGGFKK